MPYHADPQPTRTPRRAEPAAPNHDWLGMLDAEDAATLDRSLRRLATLAAAVHRGAMIGDAALALAPAPSRAARIETHGDPRGHGRTSTAADPRPRGGSVATECDR